MAGDIALSCPRARWSASLALRALCRDGHPMWDEPYLETCCRSALHRLMLAGVTGRPETATDQPCLRRLQGLGLALRRDDGRFIASPTGRTRHAQEIMRGAAGSDAGVTDRTRP